MDFQFITWIPAGIFISFLINLLIFHLFKQHLGLIVPCGNSAKELKEFQMHRQQIQNAQIDKAIAQYKHLPTRIMQWASSSQT